jgi:hypothetical protein
VPTELIPSAASVVLTDWLSMTPAEGLVSGGRPSRLRWGRIGVASLMLQGSRGRHRAEERDRWTSSGRR